MKLLYLTQLVPYPIDAGAKVRMYHVLQQMAASGHDVTLLAFRRDNDSEAALEHLRQYCVDIVTVPIRRSRLADIGHLLRSVVSGEPWMITRDYQEAMMVAVDQVVSQTAFDVIQADQLWMAQYALMARQVSVKQHFVTPRLVLDQHNAMFLIPQRLGESSRNWAIKLLMMREARVMKRYELQVCAKFDAVVWVTDDDRAAFRPKADGTTIPICLDTSTKPLIAPHSQPCRVTFLGGLHWPPNAAGVTWFVEQVWPLVVEQAPDATLTVIGKNPPKSIDGAVGQVEATGYVDDPTPLLSETAAFIVPLHAGGGMRVKIIDAWSWGVPIVSTTIGAEGIAYQHDKHLMIADEPQPFADAVVALLKNGAKRAELRIAGREIVERAFDWREQYPAWEQIWGVESVATD